MLASQHFATFTDRYAGFPVKVALLSRFVDDAETKETLAGLKDGTIDVVIGTHRLLSDTVAFKDLGLLVVDEEQRFGVNHKEAIKARVARRRRTDPERQSDPAHAGDGLRRNS